MDSNILTLVIVAIVIIFWQSQKKGSQMTTSPGSNPSSTTTIQYFNADGTPYTEGSPTSYWIDPNTGISYMGDKATGKVTAAPLPWVKSGTGNPDTQSGSGLGSSPGSGTPGADIHGITTPMQGATIIGLGQYQPSDWQIQNAVGAANRGDPTIARAMLKDPTSVLTDSQRTALTAAAAKPIVL